MSLAQVSPQQVKELMIKGGTLIDIREPREFAGEHIEGAVSMPLSAIGGQAIGDQGQILIFQCKSGARTNMAARQLEQLVKGKAMIMGGGLMAWKLQGLPTIRPERTSQNGPGLLATLFSKFGVGR